LIVEYCCSFFSLKAARLFPIMPVLNYLLDCFGCAYFRCLLLTHASLDAGRIGGFVPTRNPMAVQITVSICNARHMVHGRAGGRRNGRHGCDASGLEEHGGDFTTVDVICPGMQQLVCVAAPVVGSFSYQTSFQYQTLPGYSNRLSVGNCPTPHTPPIPSSSALYASHALLN